MNGDALYRADLAETGLSEVLATVGSSAEHGVLELTRAGMVKRVHLEAGYVVHASSSDPIDRLSEYIRRSGLIDEERIDAVDQRRSNSSRRLGVLLIEQGLLSPHQVYEAICGQIEEIVCSLFAWRSGAAVFRRADVHVEEMVHVMLPLRRVVFEGLKRSADRDDEEATSGAEGILEPSFDYEDLIEIGLDRDEMELLARIDGQTPTEQICAGGPFSETECARRLYALEILSLVRTATPVASEALGDVPTD